MNWIGSGLITILSYAMYEESIEESQELWTENNFNILTESGSDILLG